MADWADVYLADLFGYGMALTVSGRPGGALKPQTPPPTRPEADNVVPTVGVPSTRPVTLMLLSVASKRTS